MPTQKQTFLEIAVDRQNEKGVFVANHILSVLHDTLDSFSVFPWKDPIQKRHQFSFEIAHIEGKIRFFLVCDTSYANFLVNQLYAHFPGIEIFPAKEYIPQEGQLYGANLKLDKLPLHPIKVYTEFKEKTEKDVIDPYSALTSSLLKGDHNLESIQIHFSPAHEEEWKDPLSQAVLISRIPKFLKKKYFRVSGSWSSMWKRMYFRLLLLIFGKRTNEETTKEEPWQTKAKELGFMTSVVIAHAGKDPVLAKSRIKEVSRSFNIFTVPGQNGFKSPSVQKIDPKKIRHQSKHCILSGSELAGLVHLPTKYVQTPGINWILAKKLEPPHNLPNVVEGDDLTPIGKTNFRGAGKTFGSGPNDRRRHMYFIGKTGMGKSTLLENMIYDDIAKGRGVGLIDPHGDLAEKVLEYIPKNRTNDVIVFDPADREFPIAFNMFEDVSPALRPIVASGFLGIFKKMFENSWGPRLEYILRNSILTLLEIPDTTLMSIVKILTNAGYRERVVERVQDPVLKKFWVDEFGKMSAHQVQEASAPILNKIGQFLSSSLVRNMVGQNTNSFSMRWAMDNNKIVIVNLSKGKIGEDASNMLGAMLVTKFQIDAMSRADIAEKDRKDFYLYVDEFQNFATGSFATILSEARKYKLNLTIANQYIDQMPEEVRDAVFGNVGTIVSFQVGNQDAQLLATTFGVEEVITPNNLMNLKKYQIYTNLLIDGLPSQVFSADTLPPVDVSNREKFQDKSKVIETSRMRYAKTQAKVEKRINSEAGFTSTGSNPSGNAGKGPKKGNNANKSQGKKGAPKPKKK